MAACASCKNCLDKFVSALRFSGGKNWIHKPVCEAMILPPTPPRPGAFDRARFIAFCHGKAVRPAEPARQLLLETDSWVDFGA